MKGQIQFTQNLGDGSPSTYRHVEGDLTISKEKKGQLYYYDYDSSSHITLAFDIRSLSMDCNFLQISGINEDGYGQVAFLFATNGFWDYKIEASRLKRIFEQSPKHFRRNYCLDEDGVGEINFDQLATDILRDKKEK